jgi:hypothetical protein
MCCILLATLGKRIAKSCTQLKLGKCGVTFQADRSQATGLQNQPEAQPVQPRLRPDLTSETSQQFRCADHM